MNRFVNTISARLSLRIPQRESLEILAQVTDEIELSKSDQHSLTQKLEKIKTLFPSVEDFEREFPSLCFALATGVGKTRLMGAFISYLHQAKGVNHFFVLAPNLTIYNKLIQDFTPNTPKYVFQGISTFANKPPFIITGENYEQSGMFLLDPELVKINIFNISKINSEVRGGNAPRIKRLSEYIGESYFNYLSGLPDLVLLMDESHRYRASAGVKALNELKPVLGIELTATPQVESGSKTIPFKNVIYSFPLHKAMEMGYVKEPAVATRENFDASNYSEDQLERLKLEDGIRVHEETKIELEVYARQNHKPIVKPFVLIVAQDTNHASDLMSIIQSEDFFEGRYKGKVITVHSNQRGEEKDETIQQLISLEDPTSDTEIVIHVNMLKEGWDVTNLYTIIPLRAANSKTLVEQSIGRGLRLPYGMRTGEMSVDRLTIIAHDRFQEIIDEANNPNSIIRAGVIIGRDVAQEQKISITIEPTIDVQVIQKVVSNIDKELGNNPDSSGDQITQKKIEVKQEIAKKTMETIRKYEYKANTRDLSTNDFKVQVVQEIQEAYQHQQLEMFEEPKEKIIEETVKQVLQLCEELTINIPRIIVQPTGDLTWGYKDFDLDVSKIHLQPVDENILIQHLRTHQRELLTNRKRSYTMERLEDYLVAALMDYDDISYDDHAELLYKLAGQLVTHLQSYLLKEEEVLNVLQYNQRLLADLIHSQMKEYYFEKATSYEVIVSKKFETLKSVNCSINKVDGSRNFREPVEDKLSIKSMVFNGFVKCLYQQQKFDSDSERRFAVICENDVNVLKWFKPSRNDLKIYYNHTHVYEPDFIVETNDKKYIVEVKKANELDDKIVQAKASAVVEWCNHATKFELENGGKEWAYLLIPHTDVKENMTITGLESKYRLSK
ncbi:DEAD/DEAH box helicase family protein [Aneurinibacillus aneurinilyticus]|uniref:DEAD/DEAH box helicase family protein n=1 Tax=Aneurinibacillus aneurinilyticus TaxID=1391 RepID=UPI0023F8E8AE|nr:DEAD/DEAH box helicase family protein [Aneurinibacillus aneurinilyticus]MCI1693284.1 DEAD/DEAH box helicase family protein [Aneurinibacillus aneurinilyticus]